MIHISTARQILETGEPVNLTVVTKKGDIQEYKNVISISSYFRGGTRKVKFLNNGQIRQIRDVCIIDINDEEVYL